MGHIQKYRELRQRIDGLLASDANTIEVVVSTDALKRTQAAAYKYGQVLGRPLKTATLTKGDVSTLYISVRARAQAHIAMERLTFVTKQVAALRGEVILLMRDIDHLKAAITDAPFDIRQLDD